MGASAKPGAIQKPEMIRTMVSKKRLLEIVPLSYTTIYELERKGEFPASFLLTEKTRVWYLDEIEQWVEQRRTTAVRQPNLPDVTKRKSKPPGNPLLTELQAESGLHRCGNNFPIRLCG